MRDRWGFVFLTLFGLFVFSFDGYASGRVSVLMGKKKFSLECAKTDDERASGLMYRRKLASNGGMLFVFDDEKIHPFWMHNTILSLDLIWLDSNSKIVFIVPNTKPFDDTPIIPDVSSKYVIEVLAGTAKKLKLKLGDKVVLHDS
jgi:uncharacterized membrane protein (UPF0127 family)